MEEVTPFLGALSVVVLLAIASRFIKRRDEGEDLTDELTAVGEELSNRGVGKNVKLG